jgi:hypothetical protein
MKVYNKKAFLCLPVDSLLFVFKALQGANIVYSCIVATQNTDKKTNRTGGVCFCDFPEYKLGRIKLIPLRDFNVYRETLLMPGVFADQ